MSFAFWFFSFIILGGLPAIFCFIQIKVLAKISISSANKWISILLWVCVGVISCLFALFYVWSGFGALIALVFECLIMGFVIGTAYKEFSNSRVGQILKKLLGW